jgi:hypothetical protein
MDIYSQLMPNMQPSAAAKVDATLKAAAHKITYRIEGDHLLHGGKGNGSKAVAN